MLLEEANKCLSPNPDFIYDEACVDVVNNLNVSVGVYGQYAECVGCQFYDYAEIPPLRNTSILINTKYSMQMMYNVSGITCRWMSDILEHYRYGWNITKPCTPIYIKKAADNAYLPILTAFIILFMFGTIWYMVKCIYKCTKSNEGWRYFTTFPIVVRSVSAFVIVLLNCISADLEGGDGAALIIERPPSAHKRHPNRMKSIDVFRGICVILMIFINYQGGEYWLFKHSVWNGLTIADLVFPWFVWVMGFSYSLSLNVKLRQATPRRQLVVNVIRRSLILVFLGLVINSHQMNSGLSMLRFPGVLQRLGVTYLVVGLVESFLAKRTYSVDDYGKFSFLQDVLSTWPQWITVYVLVAVHTCVTFLVYVPDCGKGYLGPGGLHDNGNYQNCTGGIAGYIDRAVFGNHIHKQPTCYKMYETTVGYDPEGILGTLTSIFLMYLGVQAGRIHNIWSSVQHKVIRWTVWGLVTGIVGASLAGFSKDNGVIPINKNLWSLSFVLTLAGLAFLIQTLLFIVVDTKRKWGGRPFFYAGMNPLVLYVGHELLKGVFPFSWALESQTHAAYLGMSLWGTGLWMVIAIFMYKKNIFLRI